ncbi:MAG TPA: pseudouridine synthase [Bacteroidales bacterium]|nr:pseudouridine synthase [Bacteroidales bacterium]
MKKTSARQGSNLRTGSREKPDKPKSAKTTRRDTPLTEKPRGKKPSEVKPRRDDSKPTSGRTKAPFSDKRDSPGRPFPKKSGAPGSEPFRKEPSKRRTPNASPERFSDKDTPRRSKPAFDKSKPYSRPAASRPRPPRRSEDQGIRLNKYIANAGICSRREADTLIQNGAISVNGQIITQMGYRVNPGDSVLFGDQRLINEQKVYVLLNKPKDYITTSDDPQSRKTVMDLVRNACRERVFPVGRLDRNTTGLLLFTNDGDLAKKLTHPKHRVRKIYHAELDKPLTKADMDQIARGIKLDDDSFVKPDDIAYVEKSDSKKEVGIDIHSGQNRVVRRIFEQLGYKVTRLDRVVFAGLTKKDLPRGKWRFLTEKEVSFLKMLG